MLVCVAAGFPPRRADMVLSRKGVGLGRCTGWEVDRPESCSWVECCLTSPGSGQLVVAGVTSSAAAASDVREKAELAVVWARTYSEAIQSNLGLEDEEELALDPVQALPPPDSDLLVCVWPVPEERGLRRPPAFIDGAIRVAVASLMSGREPRLDAAIMGDVLFPQVCAAWTACRLSVRPPHREERERSDRLVVLPAWCA